MKSFSVAIGLAAGILFGIATPLSKILLAEINSFQLAGWLYLGAALAFLPFVLKNFHRELNTLKKSTKKFNILGIIIFGGLLGPLLLMLGLKLASASAVSVWLNMELVATALLGVAVFKDHLDLPGWLGVLLTLAAGLIISFQEGSSGIAGALLVTAACFCWGMDNHLSALVDGVSPQTITFVKGIFAGGTNLIIGLLIGGGALSFEMISYALLIGVFSYGISIVLYVTSAQNLGATRSQILFSTGPFWGILGAFIFLGEPVSVYVVVSILLLAAGIVLTNILTHEHEHTHQTSLHTHLHSHDDGHHDHQHTGDEIVTGKHIHPHEHSRITHKHKHYPDLHHRHAHAD